MRQKFSSLKVDIDSVDFETFVAITQHFSRLVLVENDCRIRRFALQRTICGPYRRVSLPIVRCWRQQRQLQTVPLPGRLFEMWLTYPERFQRHDAYRVVRWDGGKNYLLPVARTPTGFRGSVDAMLRSETSVGKSPPGALHRVRREWVQPYALLPRA